MGKTARTDHPRLTPIQQRLLDTADDIAATGPDELVYQHSVACQCAMPASRQKGALSWTRQQGRAILQMEAGMVLNPRTGEFEQLELPYGPKPRLILMHLNGEAIRRQSPVIPVEDSMTAFFRRLMGRTQDGRQVRMLKHQLSALAAATIRLGIADGERAMQVNTQIVSAFDPWMERDERQRVLWPTALRLSLDYYDSLTRYAVPLDERDRRTREIRHRTRRLLLAGAALASHPRGQAAVRAMATAARAVRPRVRRAAVLPPLLPSAAAPSTGRLPRCSHEHRRTRHDVGAQPSAGDQAHDPRAIGHAQ